ncbi:MAG TPA: M20/M25/M40 family metallo-hydrolase [Longimicrobium sp.]|nr:M20/M25/M40 family metallo-hydrolase [Longimicrobium sp.]
MSTSAMSAPLTDKEVKAFKRHVTSEQFRQDVLRYSSLRSRHVRHPDNALAVELLLDDLLESGGPLTVGTHAFRHQQRIMHNVEAVLPGRRSGEIVVVSAHLDCTAGEPAFQPRLDTAPGADDDASGMAGVLAAARTLARLHRDEKEHREIRFVLFNAEEHRRKGSRRYAKEARHAKIGAVLHMDMIGHNPGSGQPRFELHTGYSHGLVKSDRNADDELGKKSRKIAELIRDMAGDVSGNLEAQIYPLKPDDDDPAENLSDHTSFHEVKVPACLISEDFFYDQGTGSTSSRRNPDYHLRDDTIENIDFEYGADIARAVAAAAWHRATR